MYTHMPNKFISVIIVNAGDSPQRVVRGRPRGTGRGRYSGTRARGSATAPRGRRGRGGRTAEGRDAVLQLTRERSDVAKVHRSTAYYLKEV